MSRSTQRGRCPWWCAQGHHCTAAMPAGQHRSRPATWHTAYGVVVATRTETPGGQGALELRTVVRLDADEAAAHEQAGRLAAVVDGAIRSATGRPARHIA